MDRQAADREPWLPVSSSPVGKTLEGEGERCHKCSSCGFLPVVRSELFSLSGEDGGWAAGFLLPYLIRPSHTLLPDKGRKESDFSPNLVLVSALHEAVPLTRASLGPLVAVKPLLPESSDIDQGTTLF